MLPKLNVINLLVKIRVCVWELLFQQNMQCIHSSQKGENLDISQRSWNMFYPTWDLFYPNWEPVLPYQRTCSTLPRNLFYPIYEPVLPNLKICSIQPRNMFYPTLESVPPYLGICFILHRNLFCNRSILHWNLFYPTQEPVLIYVRTYPNLLKTLFILSLLPFPRT